MIFKEPVERKIRSVQGQFATGNRRILLIDVTTPSMYGASTSLAIPTLRTIARRYGVQVDVIRLADLEKRFKPPHITDHPNRVVIYNVREPVQCFDLDPKRGDLVVPKADDYPVVGITSTSPAHAKALRIAAHLQRDSNLVIKGGPGETVDSKVQCDPEYPIDISFIGDADRSFAQFLDMLFGRRDLREVSNVCYSDGKDMVATRIIRPNHIVLPDPRFLETEEPLTSLLGADAKKMVRFQSIRGCPFGCTFCGINGRLAGIRPERTVEYLRRIKELTGIDSAFCENATFGIDLHPKLRGKLRGVLEDWTEKFCKLVASLCLKIGVQTRVDIIDRETVDMFADAGIVSLYLGLETGSSSAIQKVHKGVQQRYDEMFYERVLYAKSKGLIVSASIISDLGSVEDLERTMCLLRAAQVDEIWFESLKIYPGTLMSRGQEEKVLKAYREGVRLSADLNQWAEEEAGCLLVSPIEEAITRRFLAYNLGMHLGFESVQFLHPPTMEGFLRDFLFAFTVATSMNRAQMRELNPFEYPVGGPHLVSPWLHSKLVEYNHMKRTTDSAG